MTDEDPTQVLLDKILKAYNKKDNCSQCSYDSAIITPVLNNGKPSVNAGTLTALWFLSCIIWGPGLSIAFFTIDDINPCISRSSNLWLSLLSIYCIVFGLLVMRSAFYIYSVVFCTATMLRVHKHMHAMLYMVFGLTVNLYTIYIWSLNSFASGACVFMMMVFMFIYAMVFFEHSSRHCSNECHDKKGTNCIKQTSRFMYAIEFFTSILWLSLPVVAFSLDGDLRDANRSSIPGKCWQS